MFRILYRSAAARPFSQSDLSGLLLRARSRNAAANITGMLVYAGNNFLQALEGEPADVIRTFDAISVDARHREIEILQRGTAYGERKFNKWSMGFKQVVPSGGPVPVGINERIRIRQMDALSSMDFLEASSAQTPKSKCQQC